MKTQNNTAMISVTEYSDIYKDKWNTYVESAAGTTIAHLIEWREIISSTLGHKPFYILAEKEDRICGVLPMFLVKTWWGSRQLVSIPWIDYGGILADDAESEKAIMDVAEQIAANLKAKCIEFRTVNAGELDLAHRTDKVTFWLPLNEDPDVLWKGFGAKLRNQIRKAEKSGLTTDFVGVDKLDEFYRVFCRNMRDLGTPVWGRDFYQAILTKLPNSSELILVKKDDKTIAGGLVLNFQGKVYVPSASSYREMLKFCPNHALYWAVIERACKNGDSFFDFGRSSKDANTFKFKKQWMPEPTQLTWQYYLNGIDEVPHVSPQNSKYQFFINVWRKLPMPIANFLGPKVIKNFP
ncbi:MAG: FemAB family PEP-CTERM system-associated protein [candidate division Zixibacteria bacterium]|nr:FemAB family PEP-CTERM system-associated protein [candidate division Zixibacteria bacterium]